MITEAFKKDLKFVKYDHEDYTYPENFTFKMEEYVAYVAPLGKKIDQSESNKDYHLYMTLRYYMFFPKKKIEFRPFLLLRISGVFASEKFNNKIDLKKFVNDQTVEWLAVNDFLKNFTLSKNNISLMGLMLFSAKRKLDEVIKNNNIYYIVYNEIVYRGDIGIKTMNLISGHKESNSDDVKKIKKFISEDPAMNIFREDNYVFFRVEDKAYETFFKDKEKYENLF